MNEGGRQNSSQIAKSRELDRRGHLQILPETKGTTTGIKDVLQHDVLHVLLADGSGTKHLRYSS